jgi:hypothetical protein
MTAHRAAGLLLRGTKSTGKQLRTEKAFVRKCVLPKLAESEKKPNKDFVRRVGDLRVINNATYVQMVGGRVHRFSPAKDHRKYWYFRRKNGGWKFSMHHPVGDEFTKYCDKTGLPI